MDRSDCTYVHANDDDIDDEQLPDHTASVFSFDDLEELRGLDHVKTRDGKFLHRDADYHDLFDVIIAARKARVIRVSGSEVEDHDRDQ
jgi:hypothetical protein